MVRVNNSILRTSTSRSAADLWLGLATTSTTKCAAAADLEPQKARHDRVSLAASL